MEIKNRCKKCGNVESISYKCDVCGKELWIKDLILFIDLEEYHFCNLEHLIQFASEELIKNKKENKNETTP